MRILINASNLRQGGGIQVADSVCKQLSRFGDNQFTVVLSPFLKETAEVISQFANVIVEEYHIRYTAWLLLTGRDKTLDGFVEKHHIDKVLTVFGPSWWVPRVPHLCGFASSQITPQDSPFYSLRLPFKFRVHELMRNTMLRTYYRRCSNNLYSENESVSKALRQLYPKKRVYTVTNYYNQVFDKPKEWIAHPLPEFDGISILTMANLYPHKNLGITLGISKALKEMHPDFKFRFVISVKKEDFLRAQGIVDSEEIDRHYLFLGTVSVAECPSLYEQCDIELQPSLLESFTATYPEGMRMEKPIVTTDLAYARQLCGEAACYYSALDAEAAADAIYKVATDKDFAAQLVLNGKKQLLHFDTYEKRAEKLIKIVDNLDN